MSEPHYGHAGTVYGGYMYISGTCHTPVCLLSVCYTAIQMFEVSNDYGHIKWNVFDISHLQIMFSF